MSNEVKRYVKLSTVLRELKSSVSEELIQVLWRSRENDVDEEWCVGICSYGEVARSPRRLTKEDKRSSGEEQRGEASR